VTGRRYTQVPKPGADVVRPLPNRPEAIYIAASLDAQAAAMRLALQLIDAGFLVTSRWLRRDFSTRPSEWYKRVPFEMEMCDIDVEDVMRADTLVILTDEPTTSGGLHVELGMFLGANKSNIVAIGKRLNVFFWHEDVQFMQNVETLVTWLVGQRNRFLRPDLAPIPVPDPIPSGSEPDLF
jgi:hypothetical protein